MYKIQDEKQNLIYLVAHRVLSKIKKTTSALFLDAAITTISLLIQELQGFN